MSRIRLPRRLRAPLFSTLVLLAVGSSSIMGLTSAASSSSEELAIANADTTLKPSDCPTQVLKNLGATCYEFTGQENWDNPNGRTVTLPVAVLTNAETDLSLEPVFFFNGGPGVSMLQNEAGNPFSLRTRLEQVTPRPLVVAHTRGLPYATPVLHCPATNRTFSPALFSLQGLNERIKQKANEVKACYEKLTDEGIDVTQYTDYQIARDFDEIRRALGYETINVFGSSFGNGPAAAYLRYYADHTRSAIFGWPAFPWHRNRPETPVAQMAVDALSICVRDSEECASRFPGYMYEVLRARATLDAKPYVTTVASEVDPSGRQKVRIDGATFLSRVDYPFLAGNYYMLPKVLEGIKRGDYAVLDEFLGLDRTDRITKDDPKVRARGLFWATMCGQMGKNRPTPEEAVAVIKDEPLRIDFDIDRVFCAWWGEDGDVPPDMNTPPVSDVPALAIHGQFDACCGIGASEQLAQTMPNLQRVVLQASGHGESGGGCANELISAFLDSPDSQLDTSCKDRVPLRPWVFYGD